MILLVLYALPCIACASSMDEHGSYVERIQRPKTATIISTARWRTVGHVFGLQSVGLHDGLTALPDLIALYRGSLIRGGRLPSTYAYT